MTILSLVMCMSKSIVFGLVFLLLIVAVTALSDSQHTDIESMVKEAGCQTNDMWKTNGECFLTSTPGCYVCFSCWGPFCGDPFYAGCHGAP